MKKPYIILLAGILLLGLTGGLYRVYRYQRLVEESVVTDRKEAVKPTPTPAPPTVMVRAAILATQKESNQFGLANQIGLAMAPKVMLPTEELASLSAISFQVELSTDFPSGLIPTGTKLSVDDSFKSAGWRLIHNQVSVTSGKMTVEIAAVLIDKKFILDKEQSIGIIKIRPVPGSAKLLLQLDPRATKFLAGDAVTALPVITGN